MALAAVVLSRRWSGEFEHPVPIGAAAILAGAATLFSLWAHLLYQTAVRNHISHRRRILTGIITLVPPVLLAFALTPNHPTGSRVLVGSVFLLTSLGMIALGELMPRLVRFERRLRGFIRGAATPPIRRVSRVRAESTSAGAPDGARWDVAADTSSNAEIEIGSRISRQAAQAAVDEGMSVEGNQRFEIVDQDSAGTLSQWMRRTVTADGQDCIEGSIVVQFPAGHKHSAVHLPFSPAFPCPPEVACEVIGEGDVRLKVAAVHAFGTRIEARRRHSADTEQTVSIDFFITGAVRSESEAA